MRRERRRLLRLGPHGLGIITGLMLLGLLSALSGCNRGSVDSSSQTDTRSPTAGQENPKPSALPNFPWPPPTSSASAVIPPNLLLSGWQMSPTGAQSAATANRSLGRYSYEALRAQWQTSGPSLMHVDAALSSALMAAGYSESSYYAVPRGFALVTRLEGINADGTPLPEGRRWKENPRLSRGSDFQSYIQSLFTAAVGHYRIIVFVVTSEPFVPAKEPVTEAEAKAWLREGSNMIPPAIGAMAFTPDYACTALIYEFQRSDVDNRAILLIPGAISGAVHLQASGIRKALP